VRCIVEGTYELTVIEGEVVDGDTGDQVGGAIVCAEIHPEATYVEVQTDAKGHFAVTITESGDHVYILNVNATGYDSVSITGSIKSGERKYLRLVIEYHPFDLQLSECSGSLGREYTSYSYSGRRSVPFTAQRTVPVLDRYGNPVYDVVVEKVLTGYTWEERTTVYRTEQYTMPVQVLVPKIRTETYVSGWKLVKFGWFVFPAPIISTRLVFDGYTTKTVMQTFTKQVPYEIWVSRSSSTKPDFLKNIFLNQSSNIRNLKEVYTTTVRQVPRTCVETYTAYRIYDYGGTYYSFLPWHSKQTSVIATPRNGYSGSVFLAVESGNGLETRLGSTELRFSAPATTTLTMIPNHASVHIVTVRAFDATGRLVRTCTYRLNVTEFLPSSDSWERYVGTTLEPDQIPPTITATETYTEDLELNKFIPITGKPRGPIYDGGTVGGPLTRFWTVDYMHPERPDGTLNYVNQEAWNLVYDLKIHLQNIINPNNS